MLQGAEVDEVAGVDSLEVITQNTCVNIENRLKDKLHAACAEFQCIEQCYKKLFSCFSWPHPVTLLRPNDQIYYHILLALYLVSLFIARSTN